MTGEIQRVRRQLQSSPGHQNLWSFCHSISMQIFRNLHPHEHATSKEAQNANCKWDLSWCQYNSPQRLISTKKRNARVVYPPCPLRITRSQSQQTSVSILSNLLHWPKRPLRWPCTSGFQPWGFPAPKKRADKFTMRLRSQRQDSKASSYWSSP